MKIVKTLKIWKSGGFQGFLKAQTTDRVHILQFRSTQQFYRTAKYQFHRTTGDGDNSHPNIGQPIRILADSIWVSVVYVMSQIPVEFSSQIKTGVRWWAGEN